MRKMKLGVEMVLLPLLQLGQDPTFTKWFPIASRTRGMCLGASTDGMVQRAFLEGFAVDIREAGQQEEADEAAAAAAEARGRGHARAQLGALEAALAEARRQRALSEAQLSGTRAELHEALGLVAAARLQHPNPNP